MDFQKNLVYFESSVLFFCRDVSSVPYRKHTQLKLYALCPPFSLREKNPTLICKILYSNPQNTSVSTQSTWEVAFIYNFHATFCFLCTILAQKQMSLASLLVQSSKKGS